MLIINDNYYINHLKTLLEGEEVFSKLGDVAIYRNGRGCESVDYSHSLNIYSPIVKVRESVRDNSGFILAERKRRYFIGYVSLVFDNNTQEIVKQELKIFNDAIEEYEMAAKNENL